MYIKTDMDRRIIRTKKAIRNSLASLLIEKPINDITIKEISDRADINRKTFYNYYSGIHEIIEEIENEVINIVVEDILSDLNLKESMRHPYLVFQKINNIINTDFDFYSNLFMINENSSFSQKLVNMIKGKVKDTVSTQTNLDEIRIDILLNYCIPGIISVYQNWFTSDRSVSIEKISQTVSSLFYFGFQGLIDNNI